MFCLYVILTISYLRAQTIETSSLPTDSSRPLFKQMLQIKPSGSGDKNVSRPFFSDWPRKAWKDPKDKQGKSRIREGRWATAKLMKNVLCLQQIPNLLV